jgi:8-amino-7-oxononanoate synthase
MSGFEDELRSRLASIHEQGLSRQLRRVNSPQGTTIVLDGRLLLNFSSNDYLGLANHPALKEVAIKAVTEFGTGCGASRLISGSLAGHHQLEESLAAFKGTEAAVTFSSGHAAAIGTIPAIVGKQDAIVIDRLVHASIVDAARLSGATLRVFGHNDIDDLERALRRLDRRPSGDNGPAKGGRILVVTESVFSMDGDLAPLESIVELKDRYGAWLMVDEAHATGLFGKRRRGVLELAGLEDRVEVQMGTLGKALGSSGGFICGSRVLVNYLVNRARSFIFSTASVPAAAAAALAAVELVQSDEGRQRNERLGKLIDQARSLAVRNGFDLSNDRTPIIPLHVGLESKAVEMADSLRESGVFIPAIRYPTVAHGAARLRLSVTAAHTAEELNQLDEALVSHSAIWTTP